MYIKQLECFTILAETLNFSVTAERLFTTQPAVSHMIKTLEDELGFKLFTRTNRSVVLTPAGELFQGDCREIITHLNVAQERARNCSRQFLSTITVGYEGNPAENRYMPEILTAFQLHRPHTQVYLKTAENALRLKTFSEGRLDIIFLVNTPTRQLKNYDFFPLFEGRFMCVMNPGHPLADRELITSNDIRGENMIFLEPMKCPIEMSSLQAELHRQSPTSLIYYCDSAEISCIMIKAGVGIAIMPDFECPFDPGITTVPFDMDEILTYGVACHRVQKSADVREFVRTVMNVFDKHRVN